MTMSLLMTATDLVELAMQVEKSGETFYATAASHSQSAGLRDLFEDLRQQEVKHYAIFAKLAQSVQDSPLLGVEFDEYMEYVRATVQGGLFQGPDKALAAAREVKGEKDVLRMAIGFEKETLLFFHSLRDAVHRTDHRYVDKIIAEERTHIRRLAALL